MKWFLISFLTAQMSFAQNVSVNVNDDNVTENTTIEIKKGTSNTTTNAATGNKYEITSGEEMIEGEPAPLLKEARKNSKKACNDWKKELREMNKDNQVLTANCGIPNCSQQNGETTCTSKATYKLKVKVN